MSQEFQEWCQEIIRQCILDCVRPSAQRCNHVVMNDPYGLCLERFKEKKGYPAPAEYRQNMLNEMHDQAEQLLKTEVLKDPDQINRCQEIIEKTVSDKRASKKNPKAVENIDIFAEDWE